MEHYYPLEIAQSLIVQQIKRMNRNQWFVLGWGFIFISITFFTLSDVCTSLNESSFIGCMIRRYALFVPGFILGILGPLFIICGFSEPKKKNENEK